MCKIKDELIEKKQRFELEDNTLIEEKERSFYGERINTRWGEQHFGDDPRWNENPFD